MFYQICEHAAKLLKIFYINKLNYKIMRKVFVIAFFNAKTRKYLGFQPCVFATAKLAKKHVDKYCKNPHMTYKVLKVDFYFEPDFI